MTHFRSSTLALIFAMLCTGLAHAQQNNSTQQNTQDANSALREKALDLLESLAGQINSLQSAENRARIGSNIVGSLWVRDEKRARTLLVAVEEDIKAGLQSSTGDDPADVQTLMVFLRLREDTVERIAKHDPEAALTFLNATKLSHSKRLPHGDEESESALELRLAKQIAATNPDIALKLARQSLARGYSDQVLSLLRQLSKRHKDQTQILYKEIVDKLRDTNLGTDWRALFFALNLAQVFSPPLVDESTFRDLINTCITTALANGCGKKPSDAERPYFCNHITTLLPLMEKIDPVRAAPLKQRLPEYHGSYLPDPLFAETQDLIQNATVDELLSLAAKSPRIEGELYQQAMMKAAAAGDLERATKIATDYTGDPDRKQQMLDQLARYQKAASINDDELAEIQRSLNTLPRVIDRLRVLVTAANRINDRSKALQLLNQASGITETMKPGTDQTGVQMALAMMYCFEKSDRGFAIMESLVPRLNDLVASGVKLDGYDTHYLRDGEWNMTGEGDLGRLLTALAHNAGYFAWCDFERAVNLASQFDRQEIRLMAQLKLAQAILAGPPKRLDLGRPGY